MVVTRRERGWGKVNGGKESQMYGDGRRLDSAVNI